MKKALNKVIFILLLAINTPIVSQIDTVFWFAAPWVTVGHASNIPVKLRFSSFNNITTVRVRQPAAAFDTTFVIPANSLISQSLNHFINQVENVPANVVHNRGFKITSDFPITVVYEVVSTQNNPETYSLKGQNGLGLEFVCPFQTNGLNWGGFTPVPKSQIDIVASQNGTIVWITPRCNVVGHSAGITYSIALNAGQSYNVENVTNVANAAGQNLSGTIVVSNKPIAVMVTDDSVRGVSGCMDIMGDQIVPTDVIGKEYIINKGGLAPGEFEGIYIVATENFSQITINDGAITTQLLNKGDTYYYAIAQGLTYVTGDKPFYVIHASGFGCELGEAIIPPLNCAGSDQVSFTRTNAQTFIINVLCKTTATGNFLLNGSAALVPASSFTVVPGTGGLWSGAQITYSTSQIAVGATSLLRNTNTTDNFFSMGIINGGSTTGCLYHYMSSFLRKVFVNAGNDQNLCNATNTINLSGTITGGATTGLWTTIGGTGFFGNSLSLNTTYTLSSNDLNQSQIKFVLESTGNCVPVKDTLVLNIFKSPIVDASNSVTLCKNNVSAIPITGNLQFAAGANWTSSGSGSFGNAGLLNTTYLPSISDIVSNTVTIKLTSTGSLNGCPNTQDSLKLFFTNPPLVDVAPDKFVCANNASIAITGTISGASTTGIWSGGLGTFTTSNTALTATYIPTSSEIASGSVKLILTSTANGNCKQVKDSLVVTFTSAPSVNAGADVISCKNNPNTILTGTILSVANTGTWSGGAGSYNPNNGSLNAIYAPTPSEVTAGSVTLTLGSTSNGTCFQVTDKVVIRFTNAPTVNAGVDLSACKNNATLSLAGAIGGTVTNTGVWSGGSGSYSPNNTNLNANYIPSNAELTTGSTTLTLTSTNNGNCNAVVDNLVINFTNPPIVNAGGDVFSCSNNANSALSGTVSVASTTGIWSGGLGTFNPGNSSLNTNYTPTAAEISAGSVNLTLTSTNNNNCNAVTDNVTVFFTSAPIVNAGSNLSSCKNNPNTQLNGSIISAAGTGTWSGGAGSYSPNNSNLSAIYIPTAAELTAGSVTLNLNSTTNGNCNQVTDNVVIDFTNPPTVNAGADFNVCKNNATATLAGVISGSTTGIWSGGSGSFSPGNTALNAQYLPSAAELLAGFVNLTLTSTNNGNCNAVSDVVRITFTSPPLVNAGADLFSCANNANSTLSGSVSVASTSGVWSGGLGTFNPSNSALTTTYTPTAAEIASGSVNLVLTSTSNGNCIAVTDNVTINFTSAPIVNAGIDLSTCKNNANTQLNGTVISAAATATWSGGLGTYNPNNSNLNAIYVPTNAELTAGSVTLNLNSTANGNCNQVSDAIVIYFTNSPIANTGLDFNVCKNNATATLAGVISGATTGVWSGGSGIFSPNNSALNATYTPSSGELTAGFVDLTLTSTNNGNCNAVSDIVRITFTNPPVVNAGADVFSCANNANSVLTASVSGASVTGIWSGGLGTFNPGITALTTTYTPTMAEIISGVVTLTLSSTNNGNCNAVEDVVTINFTSAPVVNAGSDLTICKNNANSQFNGVVNSTASTGIWSGGTGTYTPNNSSLIGFYTPTAAELTNGSVTLILSSTNNGNCNQVVDSLKINFTNPPTVNAGADLLICKNNNSSVLSGIVNGITTTGIWLGGNGSFNPSSSDLNTIYIPSNSELAAGSMSLILESTNNGNCNAVTDTLNIIFNSQPFVNAGNTIFACSNNANASLNGLVTGLTTTGVWQGGLGTFNPDNATLNATYTPTSSEILTGAITLTLQSTNNGNCNSVSDNVTINFTGAPIVYAGVNLASCKNNANTFLNGNIAGATTTGTWSGGGGTFTPNNATLNGFYTPTSSELINGSVTLILSSTGNGICNQVTDSLIISFTNPPIVDAGLDFSVCENNATSIINGTVNGPTTSGVWSNGNGNYNLVTSALSNTYIPNNGEISTGNVMLILTSTSNGNCNAVSDSVLISFSNAPLVNAGSNISVCANNASVALSGSVTNISGTGIWQGSGIFSPSSTNLSTIYQLSTNDLIQGNVYIKLTSTNNGNCNSVSDSLLITVAPKPIVNAGVNDTICSSNIFYTVNGSVLGSSGANTWTSLGNGVFGNSTNLNTTYTFGNADTLAGQVNLVLTSVEGNCLPESDTILVNLVKAPIVNSGINNSVCDNELVVLNGSVSGLTNTGIWQTLGTGFFTPSDSLLNSSYHPSVVDIAAGTVQLILESTNNKGCSSVKDTLEISFKSSPFSNFTTSNVCASQPTIFNDLSNTPTGINTNWFWDFGDATTSSNNNPTHTYTNPGTYTVTHTVTNSNLCSDTIIKVVEVYFLPNTQFSHNIPCEGNLTQFADGSQSVSGNVISWQWNFGDGQFSTIQNPIHTYLSAGIYTVTLSTITTFSCTNNLSKSIIVKQKPTANFAINPNPVEVLQTANFTDLSTGPASLSNWYWNFGDNQVTTAQNPTHEYESQGDLDVILIVTDLNGCKDTISKSISVISLPDVPTAFSPNNDGENDIFLIRGGPFKSANMKIYNNWGQLIFETNDKLSGWNGTYNGTEQPIGVYVWVIDVEMLNGKTLKKTGDVTLLR